MTSSDRLSSQLAEIEALLDRAALDTRVERVSAWSIGEQLDHVTLVLEGGLARLAAGGEPLGHGINLTGRILLGLGWLPRGVGKSPRAVLPRGLADDELRARVLALRTGLSELASRADLAQDGPPILPHPYFGALNVAQGIRFLAVHTHHHLKIVRDIQRAAARA